LYLKNWFLLSVAMVIAMAIPAFAGKCYTPEELQAWEANLNERDRTAEAEYKSNGKFYNSTLALDRKFREWANDERADIARQRAELEAAWQQYYAAQAAPPAGEFIPAPRVYYYPYEGGYLRVSCPIGCAFPAEALLALPVGGIIIAEVDMAVINNNLDINRVRVRGNRDRMFEDNLRRDFTRGRRNHQAARHEDRREFGHRPELSNNRSDNADWKRIRRGENSFRQDHLMREGIGRSMRGLSSAPSLQPRATRPQPTMAERASRSSHYQARPAPRYQGGAQ
jgi:hypothetical protein